MQPQFKSLSYTELQDVMPEGCTLTLGTPTFIENGEKFLKAAFVFTDETGLVSTYMTSKQLLNYILSWYGYRYLKNKGVVE